jgi:hypothetical protein
MEFDFLGGSCYALPVPNKEAPWQLLAKLQKSFPKSWE